MTHSRPLFVRLTALVTLSSLYFGLLTAQAATFSDVSKASPHYASIMALADAGVVQGKADGKFWPELAVNRAELLKMLYKAAGKVPGSNVAPCFTHEFKMTEWFAPFVCDAYANKFVSGYTDGTFRPAATVSVAEAVKMSFTVFGVEIPAFNPRVTSWKFTNALVTSWYATYFSAAATQDILPLPGDTFDTVFANEPLTREKAASLVYKFMTLKPVQQSSSSLSSTASSAAASSRSSSSAKHTYDKRSVTVPFTDTWQFAATDAMVYSFTLKDSMVVDISATLNDVEKGTVTCRLYKIQSDGMSPEYYLGFQETKSCFLLTALTAGSYQLELKPSVANASFTVTAKTATGDGNDGLSQAETLNASQARLGYLEANDLEDWYVFRVTNAPEEGTSMKVTMTTGDGAKCFINPWTDVDLFGFTGPKCNETYLFPSGTYYVRIAHGDPRASRQTYSLSLGQ